MKQKQIYPILMLTILAVALMLSVNNIQLSKAVPTEVISNGGFETGSIPTIKSDDFESGNLDQWIEDTGAGKGFQISTAYVHSGTYAIISDASIGDGMHMDFSAVVNTLYTTVYFYLNGSVPSGTPYDVRVLSFYANSTGKGISVKWNTNTTAHQFFSIYDEWSGTETNGVHKGISSNTWHEINLTIGQNSATANITLYLDDESDANYTRNLLGYWMDEVHLCQNWNTYWGWSADDFLLAGSVGYLTYWEHGSQAVISSSEHHGGLYSCEFEGSLDNSWISQVFSENVSTNDLTAGFWLKNAGSSSCDWLIYYVEGGSDGETGLMYYSDWTYINCADDLQPDKTIYEIWIGGIAVVGSAFIDDVSIIGEPSAPPPSEYLVRFRTDPSGLFNAMFSAGGSWHWTPCDLNLTKGSQTFILDSLIRSVNYSCIYGFDHWSITNSSGTFNYTGSSVDYNLQEESNVTMVYSYITIKVSASPAVVPATFKHEYYGSSFTAPWTVKMNKGSHTFTCTMFQYNPNSSYRYTFDHWTVNGSGSYGSLDLSLSFTADTNLTMVYVGSTVTPPYPYVYAKNALNATWYMRSDTHTIHGQLGWKLLTVNTATPAFDERLSSTTQNVSYGVRVWAIDLLGHQYELTSGSPVAIVTKSTAGAEMMVGYWNCPAYSSMMDSIMVKLYQRFNEETWSLRRIFITGSELLIRLPASTWTFHYYVIRTEGSTNSTFGHGSYTTYNSRINLQYYKASPWDVALARLWQRDFVRFMFTPWTYWFGDMFWTVLLFGCIIMAWLRSGSFKPILALLWILGGSGSILWALIPAAALHVAVIMLALAMTITLFRLIYR